MEKILVLNSGSSSLKYQLFKVDGDQFEVLAKGLADRIGIEGSLVTIKVGDGEKVTTKLPLPTHKEAIKEVLDLLLGSVLSSVEELSGVGHRVVHGGEYFDRSVLVDDEVIRIIDELSALAPLHNPAAVMGIKAIKQLLPNVPHVVFTARLICLFRVRRRQCLVVRASLSPAISVTALQLRQLRTASALIPQWALPRWPVW